MKFSEKVTAVSEASLKQIACKKFFSIRREHHKVSNKVEQLVDRPNEAENALKTTASVNGSVGEAEMWKPDDHSCSWEAEDKLKFDVLGGWVGGERKKFPLYAIKEIRQIMQENQEKMETYIKLHVNLMKIKMQQKKKKNLV